MKNFFKIGALLLSGLFLITSTHTCLAQSPATISGLVTDSAGQPIPGASVILFSGDNIISGNSSDNKGFFQFKIKTSENPLTLKASAVGYTSRSISIDSLFQENIFKISLTPELVEVKAITVNPVGVENPAEVKLSAREITSTARQSLVPTNPVGALKEPEISRQGSNHSSQIRINGTNPRYYLNGLLLGADPNHYGMFTVIPATMVDEIKFYPQGTRARYAQPSAIELGTPASFTKHRRFEMNFSTIEATGAGSVGNEKSFLTLSVRKSVLDKIVKKFDISSDRQTLPPTNFADFFMFTGIKLSPNYRLMADQYYVRDYLSYNTASAVNSTENVRTFQSTDEQYLAVRFDALFDRLLLKLSASQKRSQKTYRALPENEKAGSKVFLNLSEKRKTNLANLELCYLADKFQVDIGNQLEYVSYNEIDMNQHNWNFLPPFTNSDNPYVYQQALNETYATYYKRESILNDAVYVAVTRDGGWFNIESGVRAEYFKNLVERGHLLWRQAVTFRTGEQSYLKLYAGTFAESPANNILEPYQILITADLNKLRPIKTRLVSVKWTHRSLQVSLFAKHIRNLPLVTPDFDEVYQQDGSIAEDFISVQSAGEARFYGGSLSYEKTKFIFDRLDFRASYACTHAYRLDNGVNIPYELNAPHKFLAKIDYRVGPRFSIGSELQVRSGYPYTPSRPLLVYSEAETYTREYYHSVIAMENSEQFPTNISLNFYGNYSVKNIELFFAVSNVTNHANPIINAASGYIYDAGILPTIGIRWRW